MKDLEANIKHLKMQGLLKPYNNPCNTPILGMQNHIGKWRLIQDLHFINETVMPIRPVVYNLYALFTQVPEGTKWFIVLELKDTFLSIPLHLNSQYVFPFEDSSSQTAQLTWMVRPQWLQDSLHFFGQALSKDFSEFSYPQVRVVHNVDDLLFCVTTENSSQKGNEGLLNFLADRGYKHSKSKAQLCQISVTYLCLVLSEGTTTL